MASNKSKAKKKSSKKATAKKKKKIVPKTKPSPALNDALEMTSACRACVIGVLKKLSGRDPDPGDTLNDLFDQCNAAVIKALRNAFKKCPDANSNAPFECATTVGDLLLRVCP